jgi:hypothetical protein
VIALLVLLALLIIFGGGGFLWSVLWYILIAALVLWALGFLLRMGSGGGRWYYW